VLTLISVFSSLVVVLLPLGGFTTVVLVSFFCDGGFTIVVLLSFFSAGGLTVVVFCSHAANKLNIANR
jgi:hypothetical protein